jgi:hypothetical protein
VLVEFALQGGYVVVHRVDPLLQVLLKEQQSRLGGWAVLLRLCGDGDDDDLVIRQGRLGLGVPSTRLGWVLNTVLVPV